MSNYHLYAVKENVSHLYLQYLELDDIATNILNLDESTFCFLE